VAEDRTQEALDHLQLAALEMIAAVRAVLDVAEEAIREPQALRDVLTATARAATHAAGAAAGRAGPAEREPWVAEPAPSVPEPSAGRAAKVKPQAPTSNPASENLEATPAAAPVARQPKRARLGVEHISIT
jgi:hypothetical protein